MSRQRGNNCANIFQCITPLDPTPRDPTKFRGPLFPLTQYFGERPLPFRRIHSLLHRQRGGAQNELYHVPRDNAPCRNSCTSSISKNAPSSPRTSHVRFQEMSRRFLRIRLLAWCWYPYLRKRGTRRLANSPYRNS